jgi:hypothetical protein
MLRGDLLECWGMKYRGGLEQDEALPGCVSRASKRSRTFATQSKGHLNRVIPAPPSISEEVVEVTSG